MGTSCPARAANGQQARLCEPRALVLERGRAHQPPAGGEARQRRGGCELHARAANGHLAAHDGVAERHAKGTEQLVEGGDVRAARDWRPPRLRVVVEEPDRAQHVEVVPIGEDDEGEAVVEDVPPQLPRLLG